MENNTISRKYLVEELRKLKPEMGLVNISEVRKIITEAKIYDVAMSDAELQKMLKAKYDEGFSDGYNQGVNPNY